VNHEQALDQFQKRFGEIRPPSIRQRWIGTLTCYPPSAIIEATATLRGNPSLNDLANACAHINETKVDEAKPDNDINPNAVHFLDSCVQREAERAGAGDSSIWIRIQIYLNTTRPESKQLDIEF